MSSPADHAATIRTAIGYDWSEHPVVKAALAALVTQAERAALLLESEAEWQRRGDRALAAEARADQLQRERDEAWSSRENERRLVDEWTREAATQRERAERAETALRLYVGYTESVKQDPDYDMDGIEWEDIYFQARAALADSKDGCDYHYPYKVKGCRACDALADSGVSA